MRDKTKLYGILGLFGVIGVGIGEFLMHYSSSGYEGESFSFFQNIPQNRITIGHFLAVLSVPFYFAGYRHLYYILAKAKPELAKWFFRLAIYLFTIGGIWIGSRAVLSVMVKGGFSEGIEYYIQYSESLLQLLRIGILILSGIFSYIVWTGETVLPKWMAFFNQAVFLGLVFALFFLLPSIGNVLAPTAMNVAHLAFFGLSVYYSFKHQIKD